MCTLNCYEEIILTKKLLKIHPWADMARYARSGGEACAIAVRIARAATGRDKVAFCGYHGWHDWYLSSNIANSKNLDGQLLPGLEPKGVPRALKFSAIPFKYNSIESLNQIFKKSGKTIAAVIMEPVRNEIPSKTYLRTVKKLCRKYGSVLIFDEITSGFRETAGGIHLKYKVNPDICILGKALGNGFPISAILGTKRIMRCAQDSFISSTFWSERIGFSAALACVKKYQKKRAHIRITKMGNLLVHGWQKLAAKHGLKIKISGIPALATINFLDQKPNEIQTIYAKIMLQKRFLVGKSVYSTFAYNQAILKKFLKATDEAFGIIAKKIKLKNKKSIYSGPLIQQDFKRLN
jgi:glutamate-1-semialdehyde 2,1-aminomutase